MAAGVGKLVAIAGAGFLIYHGVYMGAALFAFIIFAGERERRAVMRAEQEAEHWLRVRARLSMPIQIKETDTKPPALV